MSKMYWQANAAQKCVFELFLGSVTAAKFAFINKNCGIGKIFDSVQKYEQIWAFKLEKNNGFGLVKIFNAGTGIEVASINLDLSRHGKALFPDELKFNWTQTSWTSFDRLWHNENEQHLLTFELQNWKVAENFVGIKVSPEAAKTEQIFLLLLLGWTLIVNEKRKDGTRLLAEGNPQEFLAEEKVNEIFGIKLSAKDFTEKFGVEAKASEKKSSSSGGIGAGDVVEGAFEILDWL